MANRNDKVIVLIGLGIALSVAAWLALPPGQARQAAVFLLAWVWPTAAWSLWWDGEMSERLDIAAGTVIMLNTLLVLCITYIPGPTPAYEAFKDLRKNRSAACELRLAQSKKSIVFPSESTAL